jgi:uncharacterized protein YraI
MRRAYLRLLLAPLALAVLAAFATVDTSWAVCVRGVEAGDTLRIRSGPGARFNDLGGIPPGACDVEVQGACRRGWCPVGYAATTGWAYAKFLDRKARADSPAATDKTAGNTAPRPLPASGSTACVRDLPPGEPLKVRAQPSPTATLLYGFREGSCGVAVTGDCVNGYCPITYRGYSGWADGRYLR